MAARPTTTIGLVLWLAVAPIAKFFTLLVGLFRCHSPDSPPADFDTSPIWSRLHTETVAADAEGAAATHPRDAREEAARKLISNHVACVLDMTNPTPTTQTHLERLPISARADADAALSEVARRLLGTRVDGEPLEPGTSLAADTWARAVRVLEERLQTRPFAAPRYDHHGRRPPDMTSAAGEALQAVLHEVGGLAASKKAALAI